MRTFSIPVSFISSPETEKERLLYALESVAVGFYTKHGYLILPKPQKEYEKYCVVIPEVAKNFSKLFWRDAIKNGNLAPKVITNRMWEEANMLKLPPVETEVLKKFEMKWKSIEKEVFNTFQSFFPNEIKWISSLEVKITKIGSHGSHFLLSKRKGQHLSMAIREDTDFKEIINLLILSLIYPLKDELYLSFTHRQTVRNFIFTRNEFKKLYPNLKPEIYDNPKIPISLKKKSQEYIKYLGIPNIIDPIELISKNMASFGVKEEKILSLLIKNKDEIVTYDQMADNIWGEGKFKSYWAINKIVQRIIKKIKLLEIENIKIIGVHGKGYKLN